MGILELYVKCNLKNQDSEVRRANKRLQKNFSNMLGEWKMDRFNFTADLNDMISNHKGIFMTEFEISSPGFYSYGGITQRSEFVLFTHCGFPLTFRNQYSTYLELDHCCCDVTEICGFRNICNKRFDRGGEEELFRHALSYSGHNGTQNMGTQFSERAFNGILMTLFHHAENYFGGYDSQEGFEQEKILGTMLYEILNCSLVASDNGKSFFAEKFQEEDDFEGLPFYSRNRY
ncbi:predicted protein [Naegleria gruberi]|uniref:Predicted protein n=1 Tax=Naegleria gruberi TaxID=5762 RepID=D2V8R6_NAEGR|nr:uncharacterized protein NAEGRDRAFT_65253 [Naegleria gruberi]EFC46736.1 predicted protein [Naegleria gruberi]|eukprot:XP_002679480.1 predicted protein [Naegleria gruberi strain NEG-M]